MPSHLGGGILQEHCHGTACTTPLQPQHSLQIPNAPQNLQAEGQFCNIRPGVIIKSIVVEFVGREADLMKSGISRQFVPVCSLMGCVFAAEECPGPWALGLHSLGVNSCLP